VITKMSRFSTNLLESTAIGYAHQFGLAGSAGPSEEKETVTEKSGEKAEEKEAGSGEKEVEKGE